jgi:hypothetical protein
VKRWVEARSKAEICTMTNLRSYGTVEVRANVHVKVVGGPVSIVSGQVLPSSCGSNVLFSSHRFFSGASSESRDCPLEQ